MMIEAIIPLLTCLSLNVYHEARDQPLEGQIAVAHVVLNRVKSHRYPNDICSVIGQGSEKGVGKCQFSWFCDGKSDKPQEYIPWVNAQQVSWLVIKGEYKDNTDGATYYHANYVNPFWSSYLQETKTIGIHIFYKDK